MSLRLTLIKSCEYLPKSEMDAANRVENERIFAKEGSTRNIFANDLFCFCCCLFVYVVSEFMALRANKLKPTTCWE